MDAADQCHDHDGMLQRRLNVKFSSSDFDSESSHGPGGQPRIWNVGSCYVTCYITGGVLYHIFLLYNMLYGVVT